MHVNSTLNLHSKFFKTNYLLDLSFIVFAIAKKTINPIIPTKPNILIIVDNPILPFR